MTVFSSGERFFIGVGLILLGWAIGEIFSGTVGHNLFRWQDTLIPTLVLMFLSLILSQIIRIAYQLEHSRL